MTESINSAGDGSGLQLPPAFVMVNPRQHRKYKKNNETVDGRTKGAKDLFSRIQRRKMTGTKKEHTEIESPITEVVSSETERAQKQIGQMKKLNRQKELQKKLKRNNEETNVKKDVIIEKQDVVQVALDVATSELAPQGEGSFAKIQFGDGSVQNLDNFSAKRIAACYGQLDDTHKQQFQYMLNKDASTYQSALDFAIRNV